MGSGKQRKNILSLGEICKSELDKNFNKRAAKVL
jgi:hypothetical protein